MNLKKILGLLLTLVLVLSLAACGEGAPDDTTAPTESTSEVTESIGTSDAVVGDITEFSLTKGNASGSSRYMSAYQNEDGSVHVEYAGDERKVGDLDGSVLEQLASELEASGLIALNGRSEYNDGAAYGSVFIAYSDGTYTTADFSGIIPQDFTDGYQAMDAYFKTLTADLPVYVPQAQVFGEVNGDALAAVQEILNTSGMEGQDGLTISDIMMDEYFAFTAGLSTDDGIDSGTICTPMMNVTPYSLVIVTLESEGDAKTVRDDFEASLDWGKWVCVNPTNALIAQKGNMVLCLMGADTMYTQTAAAINSCGWENVVTFDNPNL